jgi:hypothetical protein
MLKSFLYILDKYRRHRICSLQRGLIRVYISFSILSAFSSSLTNLRLPIGMSQQRTTSEFSRPDISPSESTTPLKDIRGCKSFGKWTHIPANITLVWLLVSIPLVLWVRHQLLLPAYTLLIRDLGHRICATAAIEYARRLPPLADLESL